jgi:hypothetical protein
MERFGLIAGSLNEYALFPATLHGIQQRRGYGLQIGD